MYTYAVESFIRYNVYLSAAQLEALHRIYDKDGVKVSEQIRRALDAWLIKKGQLTQTTRVPHKAVSALGQRRAGRSKR